MKRCPKCGFNYKDNTLEYCLEDGTRLVSTTAYETEIPTITKSGLSTPTTEKTVSLPFSTPEINSVTNNQQNSVQTISQKTIFKEKAIEKSNKALEIIPIVFAMAHNWWQWIYLANQPYSSFTTYVFSPNFLIWLILLTLGAGFGFLSFKRVQNKGFAITSLVVLAVNLIFFMVPKR